MLIVPTTMGDQIESDMSVGLWKLEALTHHVVRHCGHLTDLSRQGSTEAVGV